MPTMTCDEDRYHDPPFCGAVGCQYRPGPHCDRNHPEPRCTDTDCHLICSRIRHPREYHGYYGHECPDPNCADIRGFDEYRDVVKEAETVRKVWDALSAVISHGPPGDEADRKRQKKRFNREMVLLKREVADLMKPKVLEFIERWRRPHLPGEE